MIYMILVGCSAGQASIPHVKIDRSLTGAVMSREAAEAIDSYRSRERAEYAKSIIEEKERTNTAMAREKAASWWHDNAPWFFVLIGLGSSVAGFIIGSQISR